MDRLRPLRPCTVALVVACAVGSAGASSPAQACVDLAAFGALPDDGLDDGPGVAAALAANPVNATLCFGAGTYDFLRPASGASILLDGVVNLRLTGEGPGTILRMDPAGALAGTTWDLVHVRRGTGVQVDRMTLRGASVPGGGSEWHLVTLGAGVTGPLPAPTTVNGVRLDALWFDHGDAEPEAAGHCVRVWGNTPDSVETVTITNSTFARCGRSSVAVVRDAHDLIVADNQFLVSGTSHVATPAGGAPGVSGVVIARNLFAQGVGSRPHVVLEGALGGAPDDIAGVIIDANVMSGAGVRLGFVTSAVVAGNTVDAAIDGGDAVLTLAGPAQRVRIEGNSVTRLAPSSPGPVVALGVAASAAPAAIQIADNTLRQEATGPVLEADSVADLGVLHNEMLADAATPETGVHVLATIAPVHRLHILGNRLRGTFSDAILLSAASADFGTALISNNLAQTATTGVRCEGPGAFAGRIVHGGFQYAGATTAIACAMAATDCGARWYRDADGDGYGSTTDTVLACDPPPGYIARSSDCSDANPAVWQRPGEAQELRLAHSTLTGTTALSWNPPATLGGTTATYDTLRSVNPANFTASAAICLETQGLDQQSSDAAVPPGGTAFSYLVRARNACPSGVGVGPLGRNSRLGVRSGRNCP